MCGRSLSTRRDSAHSRLRFREHGGAGLTVATLCNADHLPARQLAQEVASIYLGSAMGPSAARPTPLPTVVLSPNESTRYSGVYGSRDQPWYFLPIEVRNGVLGEVLFHETQDDTLIAMTPAGEGRFFEIGLTGTVGTFTFRAPTPGAPLRLSGSWNGEPAGKDERVPDSLLWRPSSSKLAGYAGLWFSQELDTGGGWRLAARDSCCGVRVSRTSPFGQSSAISSFADSAPG
jgi:hypothetical protein